MEAEDVVARADRLRAALDWADTLAAESDAALGRYSGGVDRLAALVAPTVERTQALRAARDEVRAALATAERALTHLDAPRQLEAAVLAGPEADLPAFVDALGRLDETVAFLKAHSGLAAADAARESAAALRADGGALALRNFETLLRLHSSSGGRAGARAAGAGDGGQSGARSRGVGGAVPTRCHQEGPFFRERLRACHPPQTALVVSLTRVRGAVLSGGAFFHNRQVPCPTPSSRGCACWPTCCCARATRRASRCVLCEAVLLRWWSGR